MKTGERTPTNNVSKGNQQSTTQTKSVVFQPRPSQDHSKRNYKGWTLIRVIKLKVKIFMSLLRQSRGERLRIGKVTRKALLLELIKVIIVSLSRSSIFNVLHSTCSSSLMFRAVQEPVLRVIEKKSTRHPMWVTSPIISYIIKGSARASVHYSISNMEMRKWKRVFWGPASSDYAVVDVLEARDLRLWCNLLLTISRR